MQIHLPIPNDNDALGGFRLQRFEVFNWGTFDKHPWALDLQGGVALLTGSNGSGKSTLVDGLLTLLVPNKRRNYNQASSGSGKKERDERSYIQGAYGRTRSEESYGSKAKLLREKDTFSVLLAHFNDRISQQDVTLAQVLWIENGTVKKFFAIADTQLSIATHFQCSRIADLKKQLKVSGVEIFEEFIKYSQQFRKRLGLQSEKALDLFNQTVSIKEIGGLNDFVRSHMLEKTDVQTKIGELQESYDNLTICHTAIQKARKQLEALQPLTIEAEKYTNLKNEAVNTEHFQAILPGFFACKKLTLLTQELQEIDRQLTQSQHHRNESDLRLENLRKEEKDLDYSIKQDVVGQRLQELAREIDQYQKEVNSKKKQAQAYNLLAQKLDLDQYSDSNSFYSGRTNAEELKREVTVFIQILESQRDEQNIVYSNLQKEQKVLSNELISLRSRKSQIPTNNLNIRDSLIEALDLDSSDLPFIGELLQVRSEEKEWEGSIERLLHSFGLGVLVSEAHYQTVNTYVNQTDLKGKLVYYRVKPIAVNPTQRALDPNQIPYKLEIKQGNEVFSQWLRYRLVQQFSYTCCANIEQFQNQSRAITTDGLIKHGEERHEKDDRSRIGDRKNYILGWSNASKIEALEIELQQLNKYTAQVGKEIQSLESHRQQCQEKISVLQDFMRVVDFSEIDWRSIELNVIKLQKQKQELEASSDRLKQLEIQLKQTQSEITQTEQQREKSIREIQTFEDRQSIARKQQHGCEEKAREFTDLEIESFEKYLPVKLRQYEMTLVSIDRDEADLISFLQDRLRQQEGQQGTSKQVLMMRMQNFKNAFPETVSELDTSLESLDEYLNLKAKIDRDDLPRHEQRFKQLMDDKVINAIVLFKSNLEKQEEDIQEAIDELNGSLQQISYTDSTYIKLCCDATRSREIRDFREDLKICLGDVARQTPEDNEERFKNIQTRLIEKFRSEERWTALVTDVRNWLEFSVSERYRSDDNEKEHHTDSSGKSGGQKVKLAYTILASAIAYQFGLNQDNLKQKSFRFVVIDEAFSKSDDTNARYAMELFKNLNLQLLVVTPRDKINVIENYISALHYISNTPEGDYSSIKSIPIEQYQHNRQLALSSDRD
jgi:uncharacterized protein YPO0396